MHKFFCLNCRMKVVDPYYYVCIFSSPIQGTWSVVNNCITLNRDAPGSSANGNISLCVFSDEQVKEY